MHLTRRTVIAALPACAIHPPNPSHDGVVVALCLTLACPAVLGAAEWVRGAVGPGIWLAIAVESALAALLWRTARQQARRVVSEGG